MKSLLFSVLLALVVVGCSTTTSDPQIPPINSDLEAEVAQADEDWEYFVSIDGPTAQDIAVVEAKREVYEDALQDGNETQIYLAARDYITTVYNLMTPSMLKALKRKSK